MDVVTTKPPFWPVSPTLVELASRPLWQDIRVRLPMWEGGGTVLRDFSGREHHATFGTNPPAWVETEGGTGLSFDGSNDFVDFDDIGGMGAFANNGSFTVLCVAISRGTGLDRICTDHDSGGGNSSFLFHQNASSQWETAVVWSGTVKTVTGPTRTSGAVTTLVSRYDSGTRKVNLWVDGQDQGTSDALPAAINNGVDLTLGRAGGFNGQYWTGEILSFDIFLRYLSDAEIRLWSADPFGLLRPRRRRAFIVAGADIVVDVPTGAVTLAGQTPSLDTTVAVAAGGVTVNGFAPSLDTAIDVPVGGITLTGFVPGIDNPVNITIPVGGITLTGFVPSLDTAITIPVGGITVQGFVPTLDSAIAIPLGGVTLDGQTPALETTIPISVGGITLDGKVPTIDVGAGITIEIPLGGINVAGFAPNLDELIPVGVGGVTLSGFPPNLDTRITIPVGGVALTSFIPALDVIIDIPVGAITFDGKIPTLDNPVTITIPLGGITLDGKIPTITLGLAVPVDDARIIGIGADGRSVSVGARVRVIDIGLDDRTKSP